MSIGYLMRQYWRDEYATEQALLARYAIELKRERLKLRRIDRDVGSLSIHDRRADHIRELTEKLATARKNLLAYDEAIAILSIQ